MTLLFAAYYLATYAMATTPSDYLKMMQQPFYQYEANCPKQASYEERGACFNERLAKGLSLNEQNLKQLGIGMNSIQEWLWITEAIDGKATAMNKAAETLSSVKKAIVAAQYDPTKLVQLEPVAGVSIRGILEKHHELRITFKRIRELEAAVNEEKLRVLEKQGQTVDRGALDRLQGQLDSAVKHKDDLILTCPILGQSALYDYAKREPGKSILDGTYNKEFYEKLALAIDDTYNKNRKKVNQYYDIINKEKRLAPKHGDTTMSETYQFTYTDHIRNTTKNSELIKDLLLVSDISADKGSGPANAAMCRLEQRAFELDNQKILWGLAFNAAMTVTPFGIANYMKLAMSAGKVWKAAKIATAGQLLYGTHAYETYQKNRTKCDNIMAQIQLLPENSSENNPENIKNKREKLGKELVECQEALQRELLISSAVLAGGALFEYYSIAKQVGKINEARRAANEMAASELSRDMESFASTMSKTGQPKNVNYKTILTQKFSGELSQTMRDYGSSFNELMEEYKLTPMFNGLDEKKKGETLTAVFSYLKRKVEKKLIDAATETRQTYVPSNEKTKKAVIEELESMFRKCKQRGC